MFAFIYFYLQHPTIVRHAEIKVVSHYKHWSASFPLKAKMFSGVLHVNWSYTPCCGLNSIADTIACVSRTCKLVFNGRASKIDTIIYLFFYDQLTKSRINWWSQNTYETTARHKQQNVRHATCRLYRHKLHAMGQCMYKVSLTWSGVCMYLQIWVLAVL